jgi:DNA primase
MARAGLVDFERVRAQADFAAILTAHGIAVPTGRVQIKVLCPFHDETKPSLSINLAQGVFHCFGCGASGSVIDFVLRAGACDGPVAASRRIAEICGFDLPMKAGDGSERPLRGARRPQERRRGSETTGRTRARRWLSRAL